MAQATFAKSLAYFDRIISASQNNVNGSKSQQRLEGIAAICLFIGAKLEEKSPPRMYDVYRCVMGTNTLQNLIEIEREVLTLLNWKLNIETHYSMLVFVIY